jgi:cell division protein FtsB
VEETVDKPLSRTFGIPAARTGSIKNNESDIVLLRKKIAQLESRVRVLEEEVSVLSEETSL